MAREPNSTKGVAFSAAPSPFEELLRQLREVHEREIKQLRDENATLNARLDQSSRWSTRAARTQLQAVPMPMAHDVLSPVDDAEEHAPTNSGKVPETQEVMRRHHGASVASVPEPRTRCFRRRQARRTPKSHTSSYIFESIAPRTINLQLLCAERYPEENWAALALKQKVELLREALKPKHRLIDPHSFFMRWWDIILAICLLQVGIFTPFEVVFVGDQTVWWLFGLNRFLDLIFIIDMAIQFFLVVETRRSRRGGNMLLRDPWTLRKRYMTSWFMVDLVSIIPFDMVNMVASGPLLQQAKMMRGIKLLRLAKMLRMLRSSKMIQRWRNKIGLAFAVQKLIMFVIVLSFASHWMACIWGFTGLLLGADLCDPQGQLVISSTGIDQVSWVTTLYLGGKTSPDNPCSPFTVYAASLHWAVMTLTSIGYGDIVPVRLEEYLVCVFCMVSGGVLWAYIIGSLCSIVANRSLVQQNFEANTDLLNSAMREAEVPQKERPQYREYLREATVYDKRVRFSQIAEGFSPQLHQELMFHVTKDVIRSISYFQDPSTPRKLLTGIASRLVPKFFSRGENLDGLRHDLCLVDRGTVAHNEQVLVAPNVLNEDFIVDKKFKRPRTTTSLTYTQVLVLTRDELEEMLPAFPEFARKIRLCTVRMALCHAMLALREAHTEESTKEGRGAKLTLSAAFDLLFGETPRASRLKAAHDRRARSKQNLAANLFPI